MLADLGSFFESPYTALVFAVVCLGVALSGKLSVAASQSLFAVAWLIIVIGVRSQPWPVIGGGAVCAAGALFLLAYWARPELVPAYTGILTPRKPATLFFSAEGGGETTTLQIGQSGVLLKGTGGEIGAMLYPILQNSQFKVETVDGKARISTRITDEKGTLIAEIIRNEWKVAPTKAWDRNYSDDALEVKDSRGYVVLQVRVMADRIQLQGAWWWDMGPPNGIRRFWIWKDPTKTGAQIEIHPKDDPNPVNIPTMFEYPGDQHLGERRSLDVK